MFVVVFTACDLGTWYNRQRHNPSDLFPPIRPHLLKFSEPPKTAPPVGTQVNNMEPAKTFPVQSTIEHTGWDLEKKKKKIPLPGFCLFNAGSPGSWAALELTK